MWKTVTITEKNQKSPAWIEGYTVFKDWRTQYYNFVGSTQLDLYIQYNLSQNPSNFFWNVSV